MQSGHWRGDDESPPQVGTEVPRNRTVMILPDVSQMVAAVKVNEALSGLICPGQQATIAPDALPDTVLSGEVLNIGVLAETGGWRDPNRRDYTVRIMLRDGKELGLKPSMACKAQIAVGRVADALHVPIQAVFHDGRRSYVYVNGVGGYAQRAVQVGRASALYVEVLDGLDEGDRVLVREPAATEVVERLEGGERHGEQPGEEERVAMGERPAGGGPQGRGGAGGFRGERGAEGSENTGGAGGAEGTGGTGGERGAGGERRRGPRPDRTN
jgi:hypothetical protein